jgi:preprotein translocase subunit SecD
MLDFPTWRKVWLWLVTALCVLAALPSLLSATSIRWPDVLPQPMVNLGLDLAGVVFADIGDGDLGALPGK